MKKNKIALKQLEVRSFITDGGDMIKGGGSTYDSDCCGSFDCPRTNFTCPTNNCEVTQYHTDCC